MCALTCRMVARYTCGFFTNHYLFLTLFKPQHFDFRLVTHTHTRAHTQVWACGLKSGSRVMESEPIPVPMLMGASNQESGTPLDVTVTGVRGGPAAVTTALIESDGVVRTIYFGESPNVTSPTDGLADVWPARAMREGKAVVVDAALGWQHALLLTEPVESAR